MIKITLMFVFVIKILSNKFKLCFPIFEYYDVGYLYIFVDIIYIDNIHVL